MPTPRLLFLAAALAPALALGACGKGGDGTGNGATAAAAPAGPAIPAPAGGWVEQVVKTPEGGFRMGNPNAPVKLIEYGSYTCPHCAAFDKEGMPELRQMVSTGRLSYELRNFVRDPYDIVAALLARCGGPGPFFKLTDQIYSSQQEWIGNAQNMTPADMEKIKALPPAKQFSAIARGTGLNSFVGQRGIPQAKAEQCLADQAEADALVAGVQKATQQYNVSGTPTFILNGEVIGSMEWSALRTRLQSALAG